MQTLMNAQLEVTIVTEMHSAQTRMDLSAVNVGQAIQDKEQVVLVRLPSMLFFQISYNYEMV